MEGGEGKVRERAAGAAWGWGVGECVHSWVACGWVGGWGDRRRKRRLGAGGGGVGTQEKEGGGQLEPRGGGCLVRG